VFEAAASGFMLAATDGAAPVCSTTGQAKVLLIAIQELHVQPVQIYAARTIRRAYGLQETSKCHLSNILEGRGRGKLWLIVVEYTSLVW
jgi:hypothetical protein